MISRFLGAVQFLTVVPVSANTASPGQSAVLFPLVGAMLGASSGLIFSISHNFGPLFAVVWLAAITGCVHEDGLADVADAIRAGRTREKMLGILKDSRIGTYGAVALIVSFAVRWQALGQGIAAPVAGLAAAVTLSRSSLVFVAGFTPPVSGGMGHEFSAGCTPVVLLIVLGQAVAVVALASRFIGWQHGIALLAATVAVTLLARTYFTRHLGGVNGDCMGATSQAVEMVCLVLLAWRPYF